MSADRRLASLLIAFHLVAVTLAAIPDPAERAGIDAPAFSGADALSAAVTPTLDRLSIQLSRLQGSLLEVSRPVRVLTDAYVNAGLPQRWIMFAQPWTSDQYVRIDHYIASSATPGAPHVVGELVLPAQREDRLRLVHRFRDKAVTSAVESYLRMLDRRGSERDALVGRSSIEALVRHRRTELRRGALEGAGDSIVRTEVWIGQALIPPPGERVDPVALTTRIDLLERYRGGASSGPAPTPYPRLMATEREADLTWQLVYVEQP